MNQQPTLKKTVHCLDENGNKLTITGEVFPNPIFKIGPVMHNVVTITYLDTGKARWIGYYETPMEYDELNAKLEEIVENIKQYNYEK